MKRKVVQHGPSTLTISLPAAWTNENGVKKGSELTIEQIHKGLFISQGTGKKYATKRLCVKGMGPIITKAIAALYKFGYDEIVVEYEGINELERIHKIINAGYIGFEIVEETKNEVRIKKVSEPQEEEFRTLFRRIFYFLLTVSSETYEAARQHNRLSYEKLILRDENINKLADFCRRVVNTGGQTTYKGETALYHIIEQLEKIGDNYKEINKALLKREHKISRQSLRFFKEVNTLITEYEQLFFNFSLQGMNEFINHFKQLNNERDALTKRVDAEEYILLHPLFNTALELYNLTGTTMMLSL